ncbi:MAG: phytase [Bacteroidota bacterium]|jgi:3-phytase|nr:phytase [Bacteroidota bacterium]MEC7850584.1 phytase [Bacteroidota bacterium]MEC8679720.1 phytase [Bacteroidota bacterium]MEC8702002.1 phytase [Bacteroidota bacterium]|tara:strand:- start:5367 stop:6377 length:1011 start_codon:yes stop_codon:yes gene_type:complete
MKKYLLILFVSAGCNFSNIDYSKINIISSLVQTEKVERDIDDPAIWYNKTNPSESLIIGTQKDENGALVVYGLDGKIDKNKTIYNLSRPNNVDVIYNVNFGDDTIDIVVTTERFKNNLRIFSLPDMRELDGGGLRVFENEKNPEPMGVALWKDDEGNAHAIIGKKTGKSGEYINQYKLNFDEGKFRLIYQRSFGEFSGKNEIEAIAVDKKKNIIYYSDEGFGVRAYYANPLLGNQEIITFAKNFVGDQEGISVIYKDGKNFVVVSDQQEVNQFRIFSPEDDYNEIGNFYVNCIDSDGSEFHPGPFPEPFQDGLFVAMSDDLSFHYYSWAQIKGEFQ